MYVSSDDFSRIEQAIRDAEARTSGEIFCVMTGASSRYMAFPVMWAALFSLFLPWPLITLTSFSAVTVYLVQLIVFFLLWTLLSAERMKYSIVPRRVRHERCHAEAERQFLALGLHKTDQRTGVLLFVSAAEHYVEVVADVGIYQKVSQDVWRDLVATFITDVRQGRAADGFVRAIQSAGDILANHFPVTLHDRDELPNKLIVI